MTKRIDDALLKIEEHQSKLRDSIDNAKRLVAEADKLIKGERRGDGASGMIHRELGHVVKIARLH